MRAENSLRLCQRTDPCSPTASPPRVWSFAIEIFLLEREFEGKDGRGAQIKKPLTATEKHEQRQERLKPVLDGLFAWLNEIPVSGGTKLARAVQYCLNEKQYLCRCLENGNIPVEALLRIFCKRGNLSAKSVYF